MATATVSPSSAYSSPDARQAGGTGKPAGGGGGESKSKGYFQLLKDAFSEWSEDKVPRLSAALAFYTMLSIAPLLLIAMKVVGVFFRGSTETTVQSYVKNVTGNEESAKTIVDMARNAANQQSEGTIAAIIGVVILLMSASGVFGELQDSMNTIFDVKPRPDRGFLGTVKDRFLSMTMVFGVAFLLLVSLIATAVLNSLSEHLLPGANWLWKVVGYVVAFAIISGLFALMFKFIPDVKIQWKNVWLGAVVTAALFVLGKFALGWYLGRKGATSVYGTAGALVAVLLWVYYSAQIFFFGAEFTQVYARNKGDAIEPKKDAISIDDPIAKQKSGKAAIASGAMEAPKDPNAPEPWYPAVPVRRELAVVNAGGSSSGSSGKLVPLLVGLAVGKFLLGGKKGKKPPQGPVIKRQLASSRIFEPGWTTRKRMEANEEYVLRVKPPAFVKNVERRVKRGYHDAKNRISEYMNR